jgi:hypothetical protein
MKLESAWKSIGLSCVLALFVSDRYGFFDTWLIVFSIGFAVGGGLIFLNFFMEAD